MSEVESLVRMFPVSIVQLLLVNSHSGTDEEGHGKEGDTQDPVEVY